MSSERVTIREYDTTDDAKAAETLLLESGLTSDIVSRSGKRIRVVEGWEDQARSLLEGVAPDRDVLGATGTATTTDSSGTSATDKAKDTASSAASTVQGAASSAAGKVSGAASSATDTVQGAASTATDTVQQAAGAAAEKVQDATGAVTDQVDRATNAVAARVHDLATTVREKGASPDAPGIQQAVVGSTANVLEKTSQYLEQPSSGVILQDLRNAVRRSPGRTLLMGFGLGYLLRSTIFKGGGAQGQTSEGQSGGYTGTTDVGAVDTVGTIDTAATYDTTTMTDTTAETYGSDLITDTATGAYDTDLSTDTTVGTYDAGLATDATVYGDDLTTDDTLASSGASTLYTDQAADVYGAESDVSGTTEEEVLVVDVDPVTGEATSVTSTTLDDQDVSTGDASDDPLNPRTGV